MFRDKSFFKKVPPFKAERATVKLAFKGTLNININIPERYRRSFATSCENIASHNERNNGEIKKVPNS